MLSVTELDLANINMSLFIQAPWNFRWLERLRKLTITGMAIPDVLTSKALLRGIGECIYEVPGLQTLQLAFNGKYTDTRYRNAQQLWRSHTLTDLRVLTFGLPTFPLLLMPKLTSVYISSRWPLDAGNMQSFTSNTSLTSLQLSNYVDCGDAHLAADSILDGALANPAQLTALRKLSLFGYSRLEAMFALSRRHFQHLQTLQLRVHSASMNEIYNLLANQTQLQTCHITTSARDFVDLTEPERKLPSGTQRVTLPEMRHLVLHFFPQEVLQTFAMPNVRSLELGGANIICNFVLDTLDIIHQSCPSVLWLHISCAMLPEPARLLPSRPFTRLQQLVLDHIGGYNAESLAALFRQRAFPALQHLVCFLPQRADRVKAWTEQLSYAAQQGRFAALQSLKLIYDFDSLHFGTTLLRQIDKDGLTSELQRHFPTARVTLLEGRRNTQHKYPPFAGTRIRSFDQNVTEYSPCMFGDLEL